MNYKNTFLILGICALLAVMLNIAVIIKEGINLASVFGILVVTAPPWMWKAWKALYDGLTGKD